MRKLLFIITTYLMMPLLARAQASYEWMYWFDHESNIAASGTGRGELHLELDVGNLTPGVHKMHMMVRDVDADRLSNPQSRFFIVPEDIYGQDDIMYYWFDDDDRIIYHHTVVDGPLQLNVDSLPAGIHSFHTQVKNIETGRVCDPNKRFFIVPENNDEEKDIMYYWYDDDDAVVFHSPVSEGAVFLNVDTLNAGIHTINIQVKNVETGRICNPVKCYFFVPERNADEGDIMYYWYDDDPAIVNKSLVKDGPVLLDVKDLSVGIHTLHLQVRNSETGRLSIAERKYFIIPDSQSDEDELLYWYDDAKEVTTSTPVSNETIMLDVASLSEGIHSLHFQVRNGETGRLSEITNRFFIVPEKDAQDEAMFCYWFDDKHTDMISVPVGNGALMLDVDTLSEGIHILHSYIKKDGRTSELKQQVFIKQPIGGNAIAYYSYWLNDADTDRHVVKVDKPTNPYELIDMLPVESQPLRSSSFHFEVTDGQPTMYAKNDIHLTFTDLYGLESKPVSKQFVDVNTSEFVSDITDLQPTQTFARPKENCIEWFKFEAAEGDTVAFKASQTTTLQVFASTGEEIYSAEGKTSVVEGSAQVEDTGTYYVAVHDVTGSKAYVTLDFIHLKNHIDPAFVQGDANGDGVVTVADLSMTASYILGATAEEFAFKAADVNADGTISVADLASMAYYILQGSWPTEAQVRAFMRGHSMWLDMEE